MSILSLISLSAAPGLLCLPQDEELPVRTDRVYTPVEVVVGTPSDRKEGLNDLEIIPEPDPTLAPVVFDDADDGVPLPVEPALLASVDGDAVGQSGGGDPFFLGFAGGSYYPPADELVDPGLLQMAQVGEDARPGEFTYAMVMFSQRMTAARLQEIETLGCRVLGFHPHYTMKVALDPDVLPALSTLPFVRWVGPPQKWQKLSPHAPLLTDGAAADELLPFHVSVWESDMNPHSTSERIGRVDEVEPGGVQHTPDTALDQRAVIWHSNGWMQAALEQRGIKVERYVPSIDSFQVQVTTAQLGVLTDLDFVLHVDPVLAPSLAAEPHDESCAMIMSDRIRSSYNGGTNDVAIVGIIDSGVEVDHDDLPIWGVGWSCAGADPWDDDVEGGGKGHGTHCTGTILGRGNAESDHVGNAPGVASWGGTSRYFNFRGFSPGGCINANVDVATTKFDGSYTDGNGFTTPKPHVVSNSWGYTQGADPIGCEPNCRILDDAVYDNDQVYVFAAGNEGPGAATLRIEASSKNVITVGNVVDYISGVVGDPGNLWSSSSRGPCGDGRWKPNVVAPGRTIRSCVANDDDGYDGYSGTSMAAPHVTAAVATLADHYSWMRYDPARAASVLMASAMTKNNQTITTSGDTHLDTYGAGRVNANKAHWAAGQFTYQTWSFDITNANWSFADFDIPVGTTRMVAVMHYVEESCSPGASQALVNDWDFWLDRDPIDPGGNTGEFFAHQSSINNTEIRVMNNPASGAWRWKVWPDNATGDTVKIAVTIYKIFGDTTPNATLTLGLDDSCVKPGELVQATATVDGDTYISSAVVLERSGSFSTLQSSSTTLYDGVVTDLLDSEMDGEDILLGDIVYNNDRAGTWGLTYGSEGVKTITVDARSDNMVDKNGSIQVTVDGTQPGLVSNLQSPSHTVGAWSNDPTVTWVWNSANDNLSGLQGYGIFESLGCGMPAAVLDLGDVTTYTSGAYTSSNSGRYFNIRSADNCDNWDDDHACAGPYFIDVDLPGAPVITSSTHKPNLGSCEPEVTVNWSAAPDAHSGAAGYSLYWGGLFGACPDTTVETTNQTWTQTLSPGTWYLRVRAVDEAGNWADCADQAFFGPIIITKSCILFADDFESGDLLGGPWKTKGDPQVTRFAAKDGDWGVRIRRNQFIQKRIDTTGHGNIVLKYSRRAKHYEGPEGLIVQWSIGNDLWSPLEMTGKTPWGDKAFKVPQAANDNSNFRIRFTSRGDEWMDRSDIDNVEVTGVKLGN